MSSTPSASSIPGLLRLRSRFSGLVLVLVLVLVVASLWSCAAMGSYFEHCVIYGQIAGEPRSLEDQQSQIFELQVSQTLALQGSHTSCRGQRGTLQNVTLKTSALQAGEWLLLRHQKQDSLCAPGMGCASEFWQLLHRNTPSGHPEFHK